MREVLEAAERLAKEERKNRRKRDEHADEDDVVTQSSNRSNAIVGMNTREEQNRSQMQNTNLADYPVEKFKSPRNVEEADDYRESEIGKDSQKEYSQSSYADKSEGATLNSSPKSLQVPVSKDVAIVLSGRLEDPEILSRANLQLVNLVMTPSPRKFTTAENTADYLSLGLNTIMRNNGSPRNPRRSSRDSASSSTLVENRLLTPSKYRTLAGRDFGTQTDVESDIQELREKLQNQSIRDQNIEGTKNGKNTTNASRRSIEK